MVIAGCHHVGDHNAADGSHGGGSGTGDGAEEEACHHRHGAEAAGLMANKLFRRIDKTLGKAALLHEGTGQHKAGNRQQGEGIQAGVELLADEFQSCNIKEQGRRDQTCGDGDTDRHTQEQKDDCDQS